ncbi:hypothetical protein A2480_02505 [Candidatus Uhrbacteria bacterium RIFOXYC2_FULL_47_19]|uniref:Nudix hydrolase domain-containing protein n=1 Tax=Candidatus Uhrbacteria bacterium RIFOXYC2_FULL_47_19 TaxID=1802424 RepID=A0A1F7WDS8_9BACT|nr:MAG: hypothetical protein A2480_02505 [Candidatus Uhrbacteria bacterium RIFOXYC2_FULL_47_19]HCC22035.1 NUDIX hydrolase [Candidatus Uhrbacteria bacterium]
MQKWTKKETETVFSKYGRAVERRTFILPDEQRADFYVQVSSSPVCVLALTEDQQIILVRQFRVGPEEVLLELPGGVQEKDESPQEAIKRELLEETGYVGDIEFVTRCLDCGYKTIDRYCFVATKCRKVAEPQPDETEFVEVVTMSLSNFRNHLRTGRLTDVEVGYLGLDYLGLLK